MASLRTGFAKEEVEPGVGGSDEGIPAEPPSSPRRHRHRGGQDGFQKAECRGSLGPQAEDLGVGSGDIASPRPMLDCLPMS